MIENPFKVIGVSLFGFWSLKEREPIEIYKRKLRGDVIPLHDNAPVYVAHMVQDLLIPMN